MPVDYSFDPARVDIDAVWSWLRESYWSPGIRREIVAKALQGSLVIGAYQRETGRQIGYARVVTDRATFAWLCDVIVDPAHRGEGVGKELVKRLLEHPDLQTLRRWCLATKDAHDLYTRHGFTPVPADRWLEWRLPDSSWRQPHA